MVNLVETGEQMRQNICFSTTNVCSPAVVVVVRFTRGEKLNSSATPTTTSPRRWGHERKMQKVHQNETSCHLSRLKWCICAVLRRLNDIITNFILLDVGKNHHLHSCNPLCRRVAIWWATVLSPRIFVSLDGNRFNYTVKPYLTVKQCGKNDPYQQWNWFPNSTDQSQASKLCISGVQGKPWKLNMEPCQDVLHQKWEAIKMDKL